MVRPQTLSNRLTACCFEPGAIFGPLDLLVRHFSYLYNINKEKNKKRRGKRFARVKIKIFKKEHAAPQ